MKQKRLLLFDTTFFITILLLVAASFFSYRYIDNLNSSSDIVNHTNLVKLELEKALSFVKDAETGQRGYILTQDSSFLEPLKASLENATRSIEKVDGLTKDNVTQQNKIQEIKDLVNERFNRIYTVLAVPAKIKPDFRDSSYGEGRRIMDKLRMEVNKMVNTEDILLQQREKEKNRFVILTPLYALLFSVLAILIVAFIYSRLRDEIKLRSQAETGEATIHNFFMQVPAMLAILKGSEHKFVFANQPYIELIGNRDIIGKTLAEAMPELAGQGFDKLLDKVYNTGIPYVGEESLVKLERNGKIEDVYINFVYQAYFETPGKVEGIMVFCYDVTEMIINRKKIEELEQRSRLAIEASAMGVFDWDLQNQLFVSSPRLLEIFGFKNSPGTTHKELISRFHPEDKPIRDKAVEDSLINGSLIYEARVIWPGDHSIHWINVYGKIIYNRNDEPLRMYGSVIDVTAQKSVMEELKESESKFRVLSDSLTQQVWTTDPAGNFNYFNQAVYNFSDARQDDMYKIGWINSIHPDEKQDNIKKWTNAVVNGQEFISEHRLQNKHGEYRWHISRAVPQYDGHGILLMWVGTSTDVQEQKNFSEELEKKVRERTEKLYEKNIELKRSEERYYSMINEVQDYAILLLDTDGNIQNWNKGAEKIKGYRAEDIIGKNFRLFYTPEELEINLPETLINEGFQNGKSENLGWRVRKDGTRFWANVVITALHDDKGNVIGFTKVTRDLTERKKAEEAQLEYLRKIEQKNIELEQNNAELESFNYIASHDLQEPLRKIQAFSQLINEKEVERLSASGNDYFNRINDAALRMQNLIEALINYSQTNSSGITLQKNDLNKIISEVENDLSNMIEEKNVLIEYTGLPSIYSDAVQLVQLFTNLISNAIKYSRPGIAPRINISFKSVPGKEIDQPDIIEGNRYWKITIEDNGIGFEQKYASKIFELFQRLHSRAHYKGTGIGLAICKKIMRNHEGTISASGTPGVGSSFYLFFPVKE